MKALALVVVFLVGCGVPLDDSDSKDGTRSGVTLRIDYGTGCHYLEGRRGGLIQRFDADGNHMGCKK